MKRAFVVLATLIVLGRPSWCGPAPQARTRTESLPGPPPPPGSVPYRWLWDTQELRPQLRVPATGVISTSAFDWSPDGNALLFAERHQSRSRLVVITLSGPAARTVGEAAGFVDALRWSPNRRYIAYHEWSGVQDRFGVLRVRDGRRIDVAEGYVLASGLAWSPDSKRLAAAASLPGDQTEARVWQLEGVAYHQATNDPTLNGLYLLRRPTEKPRLILDGAATPGYGVGGSEWEWSPDGKWGTRVMSRPADPRDSSKGSLDWQLLLRVRDGKLYHLSMEGWTPKPLRRLVWSPTRSQALVWSDRAASPLTLPD